MFKIKTMNTISGQGIGVLEKRGCEVGAAVENPDGLLIRSADLHGYDFGENLLGIARAGAGYNNIPTEECAERGIVVFNSPGANAEAVKEQEICSLVMASRDILGSIDWVRSIAERGDEIPALVEKGKSAFAGPEIEGKTLGVVGLGAIGVRVANAAHHLGMNVIGFDPYLSVDAAWHLTRFAHKANSLDELLEKADYITIHVPSTPSTKGMFNSEAFAKMKSSAILLNLGRGPIVVEQDLYDALETGEIAAAGLDVLTKEPMSVDNPLRKIKDSGKLLITPHIAWASIEARTRLMKIIEGQIREFFHL